MQTLHWSEALSLDLPAMDDTHREFVDLLAVVEASDDAHLVQHWTTLVDHTDAHFAQEDRWMTQTGFHASNCHSTQHHVVLQVMREGLQRGQAGDLAVVRQMATELASWFPQHAAAMDAALALHLRSVGYDAATGTVNLPQALPREVIHGCGGSTCSEPATEEAATAQSA